MISGWDSGSILNEAQSPRGPPEKSQLWRDRTASTGMISFSLKEVQTGDSIELGSEP
jgi:hypothetical protein